jgi:hypothetical protein
MSDDLVMLLRSTISRIAAGTVPAVVAFLFLTQTPGFSTDCLGHEVSIGGDGFPTGRPREGEIPSFHRHASPEVVDASHSFVFGFFGFECAPEASCELKRISENAPAHEGSARAEELMSSITNWIAANFDLPASRDAPRIEFIEPALMASIRYRDLGGNQAMPLDMGRDIVALYDDAKRTIYLPEGWTGVTPAEQSLLVHEMVHHLQNLGNLKYACSEAREKPAFAAQEQWLRIFNASLASEFDLDPFTLLVRTSCLG